MSILTKGEKIEILKNRLRFFTMQFENSKNQILDNVEENDFELGSLQGTFAWVIDNIGFIGNADLEEEYNDFIN